MTKDEYERIMQILIDDSLSEEDKKDILQEEGFTLDDILDVLISWKI